MKGSEIASRLPAKAGQAREAAILDFVKAGNFFLRWAPITIPFGDSKATFYVTAEPLMLGESWDDGFYPGVTADTMQKIADHLNATLLTPKLVDDIWRAAPIRIDPIVGMAATSAEVQVMADTATFLKHTARIKDRIRSKRSTYGSTPVLVSNIGKYWTVGAGTSVSKRNKYGSVAPQNYGFFYTKSGTRNRTVTGIPDVDLYQTPGYAHDMAHSDYSQVVMLVSRNVEICSPSSVSGLGAGPECRTGSSCSAPGGPGRIQCIDIYDLARDADLASVVSHEGTVNMRMPSVPYAPPPGGGKVPPDATLGDKGYGSKPSDKQTSGGDSGAKSAGVPRRTRPGEKGSDVVAWQKFLIGKGYDLSPYGADGDHGAKTESASLDWESKNRGSGGGGGFLTASIGEGAGPSLTVGLLAAGLGIGYLGYSFLIKE